MTKIIFFDTDCISSFLWTKSENLLVDCFGNNMVLPKQVYEEITKVLHLKQRVDAMINAGHLSIEDIPLESECNNLYLDLTDISRSSRLPLIGRGEAAAIVLTIKRKGILASNNLRDVAYYVHLYGIQHISTPDIIDLLVNKGALTKDEADAIWIQMISKRRKPPFDTYSDYLMSIKK
jgi:predicted nucleic acid-binding protein